MQFSEAISNHKGAGEVEILRELSCAGIVPVIKIDDANDAVPLCRALSNGGLPVAEITFRTGAAEQAIRNVHAALPDVILGAGTVLTNDQVDRAVDAGAAYIVSPGLNPKTVTHCRERGIPIIAGCANPSDIELALDLGLQTVKFFPAEALGGLKFIRAMSAPYGQVNFMPTGGIDSKNICDYLAFDRVVACGGSWMVPTDAVLNKDWDKITALTREAVVLMLGLELRHVGINEDSEKQASGDARTFADLIGADVTEGEKSFFAGTAFELMKFIGRGDKGHLAIASNSVDRAEWHLRRRGFQFDESSRRTKGGRTTFLYLQADIGGFAVHLLQK